MTTYSPPPPSDPPPSGKKPLYRRTWFVIVITAIPVTIFGIAVGVGAKKPQPVPGPMTRQYGEGTYVVGTGCVSRDVQNRWCAAARYLLLGSTQLTEHD